MQCEGSTEHAGGQKTSYWSALSDVVIYSLTENIGQFGFWSVSAHLRVLITGAVKIYLSLIVNI
jgi:hypothetical protein